MTSFVRWPNEAPVFSEEEILNLSDTTPSTQISEIGVESIENSSKDFPIDFPIDTVKCSFLRSKGITKSELNRNINSVYPILHETALVLFLRFLNKKKRFGSNIEREFYKDYTVGKLVDRLLKKRAVVFLNPSDDFMLLDGTTGSGGWETIGKHNECPPKVLENCLSYDEIKLSALLSVSSYTSFINNGSRDNCGIYRRDIEEIEDSGIIIGLIGARFEKSEIMEYQDIIITKEQNIQGKGYGNLFVPTLQGMFINFYGEPSLTYKQLEKEFENKRKYHALTNERFFNNDIYARRIALSIDTLLIEANERAKESNKMAYLYVVGIGLGIWRISDHQNGLFMDVFCQRIQFLGRNLRNVSDICFSYIDSALCGEYRHGDTIPISDHPNGGIKIHIICGNPHVKLTGEDEGKLLVVSYAWDGNALPGNEFWVESLSASGDPAASTQITELHNPHINPNVSATNLRIATLDNGVQLFSDYVKKIKQNK